MHILLANLRRFPHTLIDALTRRCALSRSVLMVTYIVGLLTSAIAIGLLLYWAGHTAFLRVRYINVARDLAYLTERTELLKAQYEAEKAFGSIALQAAEEQAKVALLPQDPDTSRLIRSFDVLASALRKDGMHITVQRVTFDTKKIPVGSGAALQGKAIILADLTTLGAFLAPFDIAPHPSVRSVVPPSAVERFLRAVSSYETASLLKAHELLTTDLLTFAADPTPIFDRGLVGVPLDAAVDLQTLLLSQGLHDAVDILQPLAPELRQARVWPLPLLTVTDLTGDGRRFELTFRIYGRLAR